MLASPDAVERLTCSECGARVTRDGERLVRWCEHESAAVLAHLEATVYGEGHTGE